MSLFSCTSLLIQEQESLDSSTNNAASNLMIMPLLAIPEHLQNKVWLEKFNFSMTNIEKTHKQSMLLQTELTAQHVNIAAMSFAGIPLAQARWKVGQQQVETQHSVDRSFNAKQVIHDLELTNWPIEKIRNALFAGFQVKEVTQQQNNHDGESLLISRSYYLVRANNNETLSEENKELVISINYNAGITHFVHHKAGYSLEIERLSDEQLVAH
ncbi:MAG: DUF3261 domain-containing protein [Colwellia sp.]